MPQLPQPRQPLLGGERPRAGADFLGVRRRVRGDARAVPAVLNPALTLSDLRRWQHSGTGLAVIGHPIGHSLSPQMHAAALAELRRDDPRFEGWEYFRFDVPPEGLGAALDLMLERGFRGVNLTVPHKVLAVGMVSQVDPAAWDAGAVNTLKAEGMGWRGFNTDGYGLAEGIREDLGIELRGASVVLLGAGGAARGAAVECLRAGCAELRIVNRTRSRRDALLADLAPLAGRASVIGADPEAGEAAPGPGAVVINATSAGLRRGDHAPVDLRRLPGAAAVYDMIYNPAQTPLLAQAKELGLAHANGLGMLVHQGVRSLEIWTGVPCSGMAQIMRDAAAKALG